MTIAVSLSYAAALLSAIGVIQALLGWRAVWRFMQRKLQPPPERPAITVLKPLHGDEALLEDALATLCRQDYPAWQVVCGVQNPNDPAIAVVERLRARFPQTDLALVIDPTQHGPNRKVGNLINMLGAAKHDVLVIADSDVHVRPDYLDRLAAALSAPGVGLVTTLYAGLAAHRLGVTRLGATQITHGFLPGALMARAMGRQDCLGATMCLTRATLARIGGLQALVPHLADDNVLGRRVLGLGLSVALADTVVATTVPETSLGALFRHELRWARTIQSLAPAGFAASCLQYPLFWGALAVLLTMGAWWAVALFALAWLVRGTAATAIDRLLSPRLPSALPGCPITLLPLRDALAMAVMAVSYAGKQVDWRGHSLHVDRPPPLQRDTEPTPPLHPAGELPRR